MQHKAIYAANFNALHISRRGCANVSHISTAIMRDISQSDPIKRSPPGRTAHNQSRSGSRSSDAVFSRRAISFCALSVVLRDFIKSRQYVVLRLSVRLRVTPFYAFLCLSVLVQITPSAPFCAVPKIILLCHFAISRNSSFCAVLRYLLRVFLCK